jgi:hypothetical protein
MRHCSIDGRYYGDHRTIHSTSFSIEGFAPFKRYFKGAFGGFP